MIIKKTVKDESYQLSEIQSIHIEGNIADINFSLTEDDELKIVQYSQKKVDTSFQYDAAVDGKVLTVIDKSKQIPYILGIKGSPGISYKIQLPLSYSGSICITLNQGNVIINSDDEILSLSSISIENSGKGNINIDTLSLAGDSDISTGRGDINIILSQNANCMVNANTDTGNVAVDNIFSSGIYKMTITNKHGNITVQKSNK